MSFGVLNVRKKGQKRKSDMWTKKNLFFSKQRVCTLSTVRSLGQVACSFRNSLAWVQIVKR